MQSEPAHANRVATMGQLTASIAHEIKQPITAARTYAAAALRFLDKSPPDVAEMREALTCIVNENGRASDVVDRIRSFIKKAPPRKEVVDLNAAILEVTALTRSGRPGASREVLSFSLRSPLTEPPSVIDVAYGAKRSLKCGCESSLAPAG